MMAFSSQFREFAGLDEPADPVKVSQVTVCRGRVPSVLENLPQWLESGVDEVVLVDWGCPDHCTHAVYQSGSVFRHPKLVIVKAPESVTGPFFSLGRARNLGVRSARHEIVMMMDADCYAEKRHVRRIQEALKPPGCPVVYPAIDGFNHPYSSQFACDRSFYLRLGGMSEDVDWWSCGEDSRSFLERVTLFSGVDKDFPEIQTATIGTDRLYSEPHGDDLRSRFSRFSLDRRVLDLLVEHTRSVLSHGITPLANGIVNSGRGCGSVDLEKSRVFRAGSEIPLLAMEI